MKAFDLRPERKKAGFRTQADLASALGDGWNENVVGAIEAGVVGIDEETNNLIRSKIAEKSKQASGNGEQVLQKAA